METEDFNFENLGDILRTVSYIQLAAEPLLASIEEVQIKNEKFTCTIDLPELSVMICRGMSFTR